MTIRAGTSGFSYKEWKGEFYPADLPASQMLAFYAGRLPAVEINNTFYRMPKPEVLESWAERTPERFRFVLKASRRITHFKRLDAVDDELRYFLSTAGTLGPRLGAVLFQLPPNFKLDLGRLSSFLDLLGDPGRTAFEFRHPSWNADEVRQLLSERGAALVTADTDEEAGRIVRTGSLGYLRLRRESYDADALADWATRVRDAGWSEAYVFFKHEDDAAGPRMAAEFMELLAAG
ncbi:MAG: DUF72 domain-containing protein [Gemmatimonadales bacterium]|jgi:uncharacterized protein YecE (DUF72 family)